MAWNQPNPSGYSKNRHPSPKHVKGKWLILGLSAIAVAVVAIVLLRQGETPAEDKGEVAVAAKKRKPIKQASSPIPALKLQPKVEETPVDPNARPTKVGEVVNGYVMLPSGRIHKPTGVVTNRVANYGKSKYSIFENRSDNEIAGILMMKPGDALVGTKRYDKWFTKQFLKSIETPITASEDDEPWQTELKSLVKQARLELKQAYDNGEDIAAIMTESRQQLQDLGKYKQAIRQLYAQNIKECKSEEELGELQKAVNIMLEEKGCAPMNFTPLTKMNLKKDKDNE